MRCLNVICMRVHFETSFDLFFGEWFGLVGFFFAQKNPRIFRIHEYSLSKAIISFGLQPTMTENHHKK